MGVRSTGRKLAMQLLYQAQLRQETMSEIADDYLDEAKYIAETKEWAKRLAESAWEYREKADDLIKEYSIGWDLDRLNMVDKCILRVALYELFETDTPANVVLNEAIELSKLFSTDESPKFINGILGKVVKDKCLQD